MGSSVGNAGITIDESPTEFVVTVNECAPGRSEYWKGSTVYVNYCSDDYSFRKLFYDKERYTRDDIVKIATTKLGKHCPRCVRIRAKVGEAIDVMKRKLHGDGDVQGLTDLHEKHIKVHSVPHTDEPDVTGGTHTMVGTEKVKKSFIGQFIGHTLHIAGKYADVSYVQKLLDKRADAKTPLDSDESKFLAAYEKTGSLDGVSVMKRYTFLTDAIGGGLLVGAALKGYGTPTHQDYMVDAGVNLITNLEDVVINKLFGEEGAALTLPGYNKYSIPQQFQVSQVPLVAQPSPRVGTITRRSVETIPGM